MALLLGRRQGTREDNEILEAENTEIFQHMFIVDNRIKYYFSELHDCIVRKPRSVEDVVYRYIYGVRHWNSIYSDNAYDTVFPDFIRNWQIAVGRAKGHTGQYKEYLILVHFLEVERRATRLDMYISCAKYCLTERMEGMSKNIVRGLEKIYNVRRREKIWRECGLE